MSYLKTLFTIIATPINLLSDFFFKLHDKDYSKYNKILILDAYGGSGKTTKADIISKRYGHKHIQIDASKFGEGWKRHSQEDFVKNFRAEYENETNYVIDGFYYDPQCPAQKIEIDALIDTCGIDLVIWNDIPRCISTWRKMFRSIKRYLGIAPQGVAVEKCRNVREMCYKSWTGYQTMREQLIHAWIDWNEDERLSHITFERVAYPYY